MIDTINTLSLPVMESFYTIQGEGFHAGRAAYFIRLGGCDVGCVWCDVKESWDASKHPQIAIEQLVKEVKAETGRLVVITGGEPLMHDLTMLTNDLQTQGFETNIETSGSHPLSGSWNWICLSPKKFKAPLPEIFAQANELKVVIFNKHDFAWAEENAAKVAADCKLYMQPEWDKREQMMPLMIDYVKANPQWQICVQMHKYINVP
jgi:7-carboxy-7-deazaguanine synthase